MKTEQYRLYVAATRNDTIKAALDEPYSKASSTHILIYKRGKCPPGFKEMKEENLHLLSSADRDWLKEVNMAVIGQFVKKHEEEAEEAGKKFLEEFEKELEKERQKILSQGGD